MFQLKLRIHNIELINNFHTFFWTPFNSLYMYRYLQIKQNLFKILQRIMHSLPLQSSGKHLQKKRRNMMVSVDNIYDFYNETKKSNGHHQQFSCISPFNSYRVGSGKNGRVQGSREGRVQRVGRMGVKGIIKSCSLEDVHKFSVNNSLQKIKGKKKDKEKQNGKYNIANNNCKDKGSANMNCTPFPQFHKHSASALPNFTSCTQTPKPGYPYTLQHNLHNSASNSCSKYPNIIPFHPHHPQSSTPNQIFPPHQSPISSPHPQMTPYPSYLKSNYLTTSTSTLTANMSKVKREDFKFMYQIGFGGFGKVWKVQEKSTWEYYAMKQIEKRKVIQKDSVDCIMNEKKVLSNLRHPFLVNIKYAFQDEKCLYLIMDYLKGADLRYHLCYTESFTQSQTKFILACVITSLQELHIKGIVHRDIKPENLVLEETGYVRLTDFGIAKYSKQLKLGRYDSSGTPGYMAPEVMMKQVYNQISDLFAVGVVGYELVLGRRPYAGKNRKQIKERIMEQQAKIKDEEIPSGWSKQSADFINKLLIRDPLQRLGAISGISSLKQHPWFSDMNWKKLYKKQIVPPFIPNIVCETKQYLDEIDSYNQMNANGQNKEEKQERDQNNERKELTEEENKLFQGYEFIGIIGQKEMKLGINNDKKDKDRERSKEKQKNVEKNHKISNKTKNYMKVR